MDFTPLEDLTYDETLEDGEILGLNDMHKNDAISSINLNTEGEKDIKDIKSVSTLKSKKRKKSKENENYSSKKIKVSDESVSTVPLFSSFSNQKQITKQNIAKESPFVFIPRVVCKFWAEGTCKKGDECTFLHSGPQQPNISKSKGYDVCKYYLSGFCTRGEECTYSHDLASFPCKYWHSKKGPSTCNAQENCRYSHESLDSFPHYRLEWLNRELQKMECKNMSISKDNNNIGESSPNTINNSNSVDISQIDPTILMYAQALLLSQPHLFNNNTPDETASSKKLENNTKQQSNDPRLQRIV